MDPVARADDRARDERRAAAACATAIPARLIVPGLYGYVSATKWLTELELTTWEGFDGYWVPLGWSKEGADPDPVPDRRPEPRRRPCRPAGSRSPASPGHPTAASRGSRSRSTAELAGVPAVDPDLGRDLGPVAVSAGTRTRRARTRSRSARPTATARSRPTRARRPRPTARAATTGSRAGRLTAGRRALLRSSRMAEAGKAAASTAASGLRRP